MAPDPRVADPDVVSDPHVAARPEGSEQARAEIDAAPSGRAGVRWGMGDAVLGLVLSIVIAGVVGAVVAGAFGWSETEDIPLSGTALLQVPLWAGLLGVPVWASWTKGRRSLRADFGFEMRWTDVPLGLVVGLLGQIVLGLVLNVVYDALGVDLDKVGQSATELTSQATDAVGIVLLVVIVAIGAPVFEELFYRGLWLRSVERRFGTVTGVIASSLLFGLVHFQLYDLPALVGFGLLAGGLTVRSGRLGPAIWAHVAFNLTAVVSLLAQMD